MGLLPKLNLPPIEMKYKIIGLIGICALVFGGYHDIIYKPRAKKLQSLRNELAPLQETMKIIKTLDYPTLKSDSEILAFISRDSKGSLDKLKQKENLIPMYVSTSEFLAAVTNKVSSSRIEIITIKPQEVTNAENYSMVPFYMELRSTYHSFFELLEKLKDLPVRYELVTITTDPKTKPALNIVFKLAVYVRK